MRLPASIDVPAPSGARPSGFAATPGDLGLGDVAGAVGEFARAQARKDDVKATAVLQDEQAKFEPRFGEAAAAYDGRESGFAAASTQEFDAHFKPLMERADLPSGVRWALRQKLDAYKAEFGARAIGVETQKRAGVVAEQQRVQDEVKVGQAKLGYVGQFSPAYQALVDGYDGSDPKFADKVMAAHDEAAQAALDAAAPEVKPKLQANLAATRVQIYAQALETQDKGHTAFVADNAKKTAGALVNTVLTNPAAYESTQADLESAAAGLPQTLRRKFLEDAGGDLAGARIEGLIVKGDTAQAKAELGDGRFDKLLNPARKEQLMARVEAAENSGPRTVEDWRRAYQADADLKAEVEARAKGGTTGFSLQSIVGVFSPREIAAAGAQLEQADKVFAATGNLRAQSDTDLRARAIAPPPEPGAANYGEAHRAWELSRKAAADELAARQKDPAAWAMMSDKAGDTGDVLQQKLDAYHQAETPADKGAAGRQYAFLQLGLQDRAGVPRSAQRLFTKDEAAQLVQNFAKATPERRPQALQALALAVNSLPSAVPMGDGTTAPARLMAARELKAAGLGTADLSAIADLGDDPGRLAIYADAVSDPQAVKALPGKGEEANLKAAVDKRLAGYFATANALPGSPEMNAGRLSRAMTTARHLVLARGLSIGDAAKQATADLADDFRLVDGWRIPRAVGDAPATLSGSAALPGQAIAGADRTGQRWQAVRQGAAWVLHDLTADGGTRLSPAEGNPSLSLAQAQAKAADVVEHAGRWVTMENDGGLQLMVPTSRGWTLKTDRDGRPIRLSWDELSKAGQRDPRKPGDGAGAWMAPSPAAALPPRVSPAKAQAAFSAAIEGQETGHLSPAAAATAVSPAGALGVRQLMPDTAKAAAGRLGIAYDPARLSDPAYNRRLSDEEIRWLSQRYDGNVALVAAGYNAGAGAVDKWLKRFGDPRRGHITADEWVKQLPARETRDYVRAVLPAAMARLQRG